MKMLDDLLAITPASWWRRILLSTLIATGVTMTMLGSIFLQNTGPIPYKLIPDLRIALAVGTGLMMGVYAGGGGAHRRGMALWGVLGIVIAFHLEEATVHWIGPIPGSITGTPVGLVGTAGSLLAIAAVLLLHVEVESGRLARDLAQRGAPQEEAGAMAARLSSAGARRIVAILAGVAGLGAIVLAVSPAFGTEAPGGALALVPGGILLLVLAAVLARWVPRASSSPG